MRSENFKLVHIKTLNVQNFEPSMHHHRKLTPQNVPLDWAVVRWYSLGDGEANLGITVYLHSLKLEDLR